MSSSGKKIVLAKPKSMWNRKIKFDFKPLFRSLGKAVTHAATLKFEELGNDALEASVSLGLDMTAAEVAYILLRRSVISALFDLTKESFSYINQENLAAEDLNETVAAALEGITIILGKEFFVRPQKAVFLDKIVQAYKHWLVDKGCLDSAAESIARRLPAYYTFSLANEWRNNTTSYSQLLDKSENPFASSESAANGWQLYFSYLKRRVSENVFDEPFGLSQLYIPLNAYFTRAEESTSSDEKKQELKVCVRLDQELKDWLKTKDKSDAVRVISGGPGSGKSSFAKILCAELAEVGEVKPIYIPLHLIDPTRDIVQEVERFVRDEGLIGFNPLDPDRQEDDLLIVFDGLDELASLGKASAQVARDFVLAVERMVERRNLGRNPISVLLSGRELIIQENETAFRRPKQILTILPYYVPKDQNNYMDPKKILSVDLRQNWWQNYSKLLGMNLEGLPGQLKNLEIDEITAQPLLNYLVALSYRRGKLDFDGALNLNNVYADLVAAVHERAYEKARTYGPIKHLSLKEFIRVLEEIALAAWHGSDGRSTSVREIMKHCEQSGLDALLKTFTEGAQAGVTKLLAAFFFRRNNEIVGDDAVFVFTHKSFGEYLTGARIAKGLERIIVERGRRENSLDEGMDIQDALALWTKLTGPAPMTEYLQKFLVREVAQRGQAELQVWQRTIVELLSTAIERSMPLERLGNLTFSASARYDANASTALVIALNACSLALKSPAKLRFSVNTSFGTFLKRMCPQRFGPRNPILLSVLSFLDISGQCLDMIDLYGANLSFSVFTGCHLHFANLGSANLDNSDFSFANCSGCRFDSAHLEAADCSKAIMSKCSFRFCAITRTDLSDAVLELVDFSRAMISDSSFDRAFLVGSNLQKAQRFDNCSHENAMIAAEDKELRNWFKTKGLNESNKLRELSQPEQNTTRESMISSRRRQAIT